MLLSMKKCGLKIKEQQFWLLILCLLLVTFIVANLPGTFVIPVPVFKSRPSIQINTSSAVEFIEKEAEYDDKQTADEKESDKYAEFLSRINIRLWIDVPNSFPWRKCLHEYNDMVFTFSCGFGTWDTDRQSLTLVPLQGSLTKFQLQCSRRCTQWSQENENITICLEQKKGKAMFVQDCSESMYWRWTKDALLEWSGGGCLASTGGQDGAVVVPCDKDYEDQRVEIGVVEDNKTLVPLDLGFWQERMKRTRDLEMALAKVEVERVIMEIKEQNRTGDFESRVEGRRRAIVFYVDKGSGFLAYLTWWLFAWRQIGLDGQQESFDVILLTHPASVDKLPKECTPVPPEYDPLMEGPGQCLWREMLPMSERDHRYDDYVNSQECLFNPAAKFLLKYRLLIRADMDTFPTPRMVGLWPRDIICNRFAVTTHYRPDIENAIIASATAVGITHHHWHNTDSAWMGPAHRVVALAKLTTHLTRFVRAHMFGPGTVCKCANCTEIPEKCTWGQGIYAGTLLLYAQEIAMNHLWTQREYTAQSRPLLDGSCTDENMHVCESALLHARHNADPFSKFTFLGGKYKEYNMSQLNITNVRDYSMYMALASHDQGVGREVAWGNYMAEQQKPLGDICKREVVPREDNKEHLAHGETVQKDKREHEAPGDTLPEDKKEYESPGDTVPEEKKVHEAPGDTLGEDKKEHEAPTSSSPSGARGTRKTGLTITPGAPEQEDEWGDWAPGDTEQEDKKEHEAPEDIVQEDKKKKRSPAQRI